MPSRVFLYEGFDNEGIILDGSRARESCTVSFEKISKRFRVVHVCEMRCERTPHRWPTQRRKTRICMHDGNVSREEVTPYALPCLPTR